ncbi:MAG: hypothetical protein E5Y59_24740, partial [Mesorhizobium sp.]
AFIVAVVLHNQHVEAGLKNDVGKWNRVLEANPTAEAGFAELKEIEALVLAAGYGPDRIRIDPSVVRGLEYYTGPVYEAELLAEIPNEEGKIVRFGSVGGGGRYDGL